MITISNLIHWRRRHPLVLLVALVALAGACARTGPEAGPGSPVTAVAAFYPPAEAVAEIGGNRVEVTNLTPAGAEPHDLELDPAALESVVDADLVLYVGGGFQPSLDAALGRAGGELLDVLEGLPLREAAGDHGHDAEDHDGDVDPHVWLDPRLWARAVSRIAEVLARLDPGGAESYGNGAARYLGALERLDGDYERGLASCERDLIVTSHASFGYLADRYGLRQEAVAGVAPEAEPDPRRLAELADLVSREGVTTVFTEVLVPPQIARTLARETGAGTAVLDPIESEPEGGYAAAMRRNLSALREALGCR